MFDVNGNTIDLSKFEFHDSDEADEKAKQIIEAYDLSDLSEMSDE